MTALTKYALKGRMVAICLVLLLAALLAGCAGVQAAQPVSASSVQAMANWEAAAGPATSTTNETPLVEASGPSLLSETQSSEGGGVTIQATPAGTVGGDLAISLSLNTHSVDLNYDYRALASLLDDQGHVYPATRWDGGSGGHHLTGKLLFSNSPLRSSTSAKWVELEIKDVAGVPLRTFRWNVG